MTQPVTDFNGFLGSTPTGGAGFPTAAPSVTVPYEFQKNSGLAVPGLAPPGVHPRTGPMTIPQHGLSGGTQTPESSAAPVTMEQGLLNLLEAAQTNPQDVATLQRSLVRAGYLNPDDTTFVNGSVSTGDATYDAYARLLNDAVVTGTSYTKILDKRINNPKNQSGQNYWQTYQERYLGKPVTRTETSDVVDLTDAPDARAIAQNAYQSLLGRNVSDQESAAFQGALNAYEQSNPTQTTSQVEYDPRTGATNTRDATQSGGINEAGASQMAQSDIIQNHGAEYAQTQGDQVYKLFASLLSGGG